MSSSPIFHRPSTLFLLHCSYFTRYGDKKRAVFQEAWNFRFLTSFYYNLYRRSKVKGFPGNLLGEGSKRKGASLEIRLQGAKVTVFSGCGLSDESHVFQPNRDSRAFPRQAGSISEGSIAIWRRQSRGWST